jgi:hypothetical protein
MLYVIGTVPDSIQKLPALTTLPRSEWAKIRKTHFTHGKNHQSMESIEKSIMIVVLSDENPRTLSEKGKQLLHADGKTLWFG